MYLLLSLVWADYGVIAYDRLEKHRDRLEKNLDELEERRTELAAETRALRTEAEQIRIEARRLGYFEENEGLVRLDGWEPERSPSSPGALVRNRPSPPDHAAVIRAAAASAGLFTLFIMILIDQREHA